MNTIILISMKKWKKIGMVFIGIFILINVGIILSGKSYVYRGIARTYLKGELHPSIYDLKKFPYSTVSVGDHEISIIEKTRGKLKEEDEKWMGKMKTRAFLVFKNDTLIFEKYFNSHNQETYSNSFSMAKTIVGMLVGIAMEEGHISSLKEPVYTYIPEFKQGSKKKITIEDLLTMSSGLDWSESTKNPFSDNAEAYYGTNLYKIITSVDVKQDPGKQFIYQSVNTQILGYIIEKATGEDLTEYAEKKIWNKIGKKDAYWSLDRKNGDEKAFCCFYAVARDFGRLGILLEKEGKIKDQELIPEKYFKEMVRPRFHLMTEERIPNYRYGYQIWTYLDNNTKVNYFRGAFGQYIIAIPEENIVIVRLGEKKQKNFALDKRRKNDPVYFEENKFKVGHSIDFLKYLKIGKDIANHEKRY